MRFSLRRSRTTSSRRGRLFSPRSVRLSSIRAGQHPVLAVDLPQLACSGQAAQLLAQLTPLLAAAQAQLAHQLLVPGAASRQALDVAQQFAVVHL